MQQVALSAPTRRADAIIRERFMIMLKSFNEESSSPHDAPITIRNKIDASLPALNYHMVDDYHFWNPKDRPDPDFVVGCTSCRPHMGGNVGCEYTKLCECLEEAAVDEKRLEGDEQGRRRYHAEKAKKAADPTYIMDTSGLPKRFPYSKESKMLLIKSTTGANLRLKAACWYRSTWMLDMWYMSATINANAERTAKQRSPSSDARCLYRFSKRKTEGGD
jgi:hypothetical protein